MWDTEALPPGGLGNFTAGLGAVCVAVAVSPSPLSTDGEKQTLVFIPQPTRRMGTGVAYALGRTKHPTPWKVGLARSCDLANGLRAESEHLFHHVILTKRTASRATVDMGTRSLRGCQFLLQSLAHRSSDLFDL